jgi:hypothetical protein
MMKEKQENIDELIKQALTEEESEYLDKLGEQSLIQEGLGLFKGRRAWVSIYVGVVMLLITAATVYCLTEFFRVEETKELMIWGGGFFLGLFMISILKIWAWMQMGRNAIMRELKRIELQVSTLHSKYSK